MSDRLQELRRQRALVQEHLAWLDREIAAAAPAIAMPESPWPAKTPAAPPAPLAPSVVPVAVGAPAAEILPAEVAATADAILDEYRVQPDNLKTDVKKGCFLYFFAALGLVVLAVFAFYFAKHGFQ